MDIKEIVKEYQGEGSSPIYAAFNLITFAKAIPWHIGKALLLALLLYGVLTYAMVQMGFGYLLLLLGFIVGLVWAVTVGFTAGIHFITSALIQNFSELLGSVLQPVDHLYDRWQADTKSKVSRAAFFKDVAKEVVIPEFNKMMGFLPFKGKIVTYMQAFIDRIFSNSEGHKISETAASDISQAGKDPGFVADLEKSIEEGSRHIRAKIASPFWSTLKWGLLFWGLIFLLHYLF